MAEEHAAWSADNDGSIGALGVLEAEIGVSFPDIARINGLRVALRRFEDNRRRWVRMNAEDTHCLQKHLCFTVLVPAGRADKARQAVELLRGKRVIPFKPNGTDNFAIIRGVAAHTVRFPMQKTVRLAANITHWPATQELCVAAVKDDWDAITLRKTLMRNVQGFGHKAAAHFMRNTGLSHGENAVPIIDTHIRKALVALNLPNKSYDEAETAFRDLARRIGVSVLLLDAILWCAYAKNEVDDTADFDNFGYEFHQHKSA